MSVPFVGVIVVGTNDGCWLDTCFHTLTTTTYPNLLIVYVDNASKDGSLDIVKNAYPHVKILQNAMNLGFAGANNQGIRYALEHGVDYIILINPDTRTPAELITKLVSFLENNPSYGIIGPLQSAYGSSETEQPSPNRWTRHVFENGEKHVFHHWASDLPSEAGSFEGRAPKTLEHAYVQGSAFAMRVSVIHQVGLFDTTYHTFYEEVDLCRRVRWAGYRVALIKDLWIEHAGGSDDSPSFYRAFHMTRNRFLYLFTEPGIPALTVLRLTFCWIIDDITVQIRQEQGLVKSWFQYAQIWLSLASLIPYIVCTRLRNSFLSATSTSALSHKL